MNDIYRIVLNDKIIKTGMAIAMVIIIIEMLVIAILFFSLPPLVPIYNQLPWGAQRLGNTHTLFFPSLLSLLFFIINFYMIIKLHEKTPLLSRILSITTLLISILSIIFTMRTLQAII